MPIRHISGPRSPRLAHSVAPALPKRPALDGRQLGVFLRQQLPLQRQQRLLRHRLEPPRWPGSGRAAAAGRQRHRRWREWANLPDHRLRLLCARHARRGRPDAVRPSERHQRHNRRYRHGLCERDWPGRQHRQLHRRAPAPQLPATGKRQLPFSLLQQRQDLPQRRGSLVTPVSQTQSDVHCGWSGGTG